MLGDRRPLTPEDFQHKSLDAEQVVLVLDHVLREFDAMRHWERDDLYARCKRLADHLGLKIRDFLFPLFVAISGRGVSLPLFDSLIFLGPDLSRMRLRDALAMLGASKKQGKRLEKQYRQFLAIVEAATS